MGLQTLITCPTLPSFLRESNSRPSPYHGDALPTELRKHARLWNVGFEPTTDPSNGLLCQTELIPVPKSTCVGVPRFPSFLTMIRIVYEMQVKCQIGRLDLF